MNSKMTMLLYYQYVILIITRIIVMSTIRVQADNNSIYSLVKAGTCDAVPGRAQLLDLASCRDAAMVFGVNLSASSVEIMGPNNPYPVGCSVDTCCNRQALRLQRNEKGRWGDSQPDCTADNPCLCISGVNNCTHIDMAQSNDAPCACGSSACTKVSGLFCNSSKSTCSRGQTCAHTDGVTPNTVPCACGLTNSCNAFNGMYCFSNARFSVVGVSPIDFCSVVDGSSENSGECQCGSSRCTSTTGLICYSKTGRGSCRSTGLGAYGYEKVFSGYCDSVEGSRNIESTEQCAKAAKSLGLSDTTPENLQLTSRAVGCTWKWRSDDVRTGLIFQPANLGVEIGGKATKCERETFCICVAGTISGSVSGGLDLDSSGSIVLSTWWLLIITIFVCVF